MAPDSSAKRLRIARCFVRTIRAGFPFNLTVQAMTSAEFAEWYQWWVDRHRPDLAPVEVRSPTSDAVRESLLTQLEEWGIPPVMFKE